MLKNHLITALRNLARHKVYSPINIAGLAIGLASCVLILLFVRNELSYDDWYFMNGWLSGFAYRIDLSIFYFLGAGALALIIAWATVGIHAARVARANPIHALRYE